MKLDWNNITSDDVYEAIRIFEHTMKKYPNAKNTFLGVNGKLYPAKQRRMPYISITGI